jgi:hypothetical protein
MLRNKSEDGYAFKQEEKLEKVTIRQCRSITQYLWT